MVEGTGLKVLRRGHVQWHDLPTEFHKNLPIGSKVIRGDKQTDGFISLTFLFKESRLKSTLFFASTAQTCESNVQTELAIKEC
jgi:hypothetical protein